MPFEKAGVPATCVDWQPHPDLHKPSDTPAPDPQKIEFIARATLRLIETFEMSDR